MRGMSCHDHGLHSCRTVGDNSLPVDRRRRDNGASIAWIDDDFVLFKGRGGISDFSYISMEVAMGSLPRQAPYVAD